MGNLEFNDGVGEVETTVATRKLKLFNGEGREVAKANDCLCSGNECLRKIAYNWCENGAGENAHVKIQATG